MQQGPEAIRHELIVLIRKRARVVGDWKKGMPSDWRPTQTRNPETCDCFTPNGAWHFIADLLEGGHPFEEITLRNPPGKRAYVIHVNLGQDLPPLYVKLQLGAGKVIGRSFHYAEPETE